jgi:hypothetical protein
MLGQPPRLFKQHGFEKECFQLWQQHLHQLPAVVDQLLQLLLHFQHCCGCCCCCCVRADTTCMCCRLLLLLLLLLLLVVVA